MKHIQPRISSPPHAMAAAAASPFPCVPEDATPSTSLQDRVHELEARVRVMTPLLSMLLEEKMEKEETGLKGITQSLALVSGVYTLFEGVLASTSTEEALAKYREAEGVLPSLGFTLATPSSAFVPGTHRPLDILGTVIYCIRLNGLTSEMGAFDTTKGVEGAAAHRNALRQRYEGVKAIYEKQQARVASLQAQHAALNAEALREEEARRKEAARRALEEQIAALQAKLASL